MTMDDVLQRLKAKPHGKILGSFLLANVSKVGMNLRKPRACPVYCSSSSSPYSCTDTAGGVGPLPQAG